MGKNSQLVFFYFKIHIHIKDINTVCLKQIYEEAWGKEENSSDDMETCLSL